MQQSSVDGQKAVEGDYDKHIRSIMDEIAAHKQKAAKKYNAIKYDQTKPKSCKYKTPIMEDLYPKVELAE
jgi:hypothetical protein